MLITAKCNQEILLNNTGYDFVKITSPNGNTISLKEVNGNLIIVNS